MTDLFFKDPDDAIDAAILSGMMAVGGHPTNDDQRRTYARALISHLFANLEPPEDSTCYEVDLFNDAKRALLKAAGLEDLA